MNINSDFSLKNVKMPSKVEQTKVPEGYVQDEKTSIILPDIRSNQFLLPDNKIYVTNSNKTKPDFNKNNISIELPKNYKKVDKKDEKPMTVTARKKYTKSKVEQYKNTQTNENIIRLSKNNFSTNGLLDSAEVIEINTKNPRKAVRYIKDYENNRETEIQISNPFNLRKKTNDSMTTIHKDNNGHVIKTEEYKKSVLPGIYNITETDAAGNKTIISKATKDENGNILVEKNLVSLDGTKTEYRFESDKDGLHKKLFTQITDADGNVLSTIDRTFDKESENVTYSSVNGNKFKAEKKDGKLEITNYLTGEKTLINPDDKKPTEDDKEFAGALANLQDDAFSDENVLDELFDKMPADAILTMNSNVKTIIPLKDDIDSAFLNVFDILICKTDDFVINHELGHSKDSNRIEENANFLTLKIKEKNPIASNNNFYKAYTEEKAAFAKNFPDFEEKFINYFLNGTEENRAAGRKETVAEANAINGLNPQTPEISAMRTIFLQRYFPRSIAELTKLMNPIALAENTKNSENITK